MSAATTLILIFEQLGAGATNKTKRLIARFAVGPWYLYIASAGEHYRFVVSVNGG